MTDVTATYVAQEADQVFYRSERLESTARPGDLVYVVVADYESGDTFGRSGGQYQVLDVFTDPTEAQALADAAAAVGRGDFTLRHRGKEYHVSWTGYFESLNSVRVWMVKV